MRVQPAGERPVRLPQRLESLGIFDGGFDPEPVADDPRIREQTVDLGLPKPAARSTVKSA